MKTGPNRTEPEPKLRVNMSAAVCFLILTLSTLSGVASGVLSGPTNVQLTSRNLDLNLTWEQPAEAPSGLVYTTQFRSTATPYRGGCGNITTLQCDLTSFDISRYGTYTGRVRVLLGAEASAWVESNSLTIDKDTVIGPPQVSLHPNGPTLEVTIKDPEFHTSSLRDVYHFINYTITYWKKSQKEQSNRLLHVEQDRVVLNQLDPLSEYCVQVQINTFRNKNPSSPSSVTCAKTGDSDQPPLIAAVLSCLVIVAAVALTVLAVLRWKSISQLFWPKVVLPRHFEKSLLPAPDSSVCLVAQPTEEVVPVSVVTVETTTDDNHGEENAVVEGVALTRGSETEDDLRPAC